MSAKLRSLQALNDSEANKLASVFQTVDTWSGLSGSTALTAMGNNYSIDQSHIGLEVSKEFYSVLYGGGDGKLPSTVSMRLGLFFISFKASDIYHQFRFLVRYLEAGKGNQPVAPFIQAIREDRFASPHWQISPNEEVLL